LNEDGTTTPLPNQADRFFWHHNSLFSLEIFRPKVHNYNDDEYEQEYDYPGHEQGYLVVRCFGSSHAPTGKLLKFIEDELVKNEKLQVTKVMADTSKVNTLRAKRPLATIDLELEQLREIREDAECFFHESTPASCRDTGTPPSSWLSSLWTAEYW
jgi:hypothetical protein